ncbi:Fc receptor-like protein 5-like [Platysternon megacephalum]|uniref:Fc receptor-like protein 5-like n=1 Tax=Platysternon megacephalum TaxID=55544 RepID=A0A4D9DKP3_9SAUR|nr:Fc receptor-like protein 5-like [Platysternon megacephalum]
MQRDYRGRIPPLGRSCLRSQHAKEREAEQEAGEASRAGDVGDSSGSSKGQRRIGSGCSQHGNPVSEWVHRLQARNLENSALKYGDIAPLEPRNFQLPIILKGTETINQPKGETKNLMNTELRVAA